MAKSDRGNPVSRWQIVLTGAMLGFLWGTFLWLVTGRSGGTYVWLYIAVSCAMIGTGVAAAFGARAVRRNGEKIGPSLFRRK